jgi:predicted RNA-binding Zn-ribbon protein involved in translation (DUF1610 family)
MKTLDRKTGTFSLEEAARIRWAIETTGSARCPGCDVALSNIVGENGRSDVWLLQCPACGRGLVLRSDPARPADREGASALS